MFVGLDVHKKYAEVAIIDEDGVIEKQERIENEPGKIEEFSNMLSNAEMVLESSSTWYCYMKYSLDGIGLCFLIWVRPRRLLLRS
jgi:predicted NBD/HSP70 family sugar kinase